MCRNSEGQEENVQWTFSARTTRPILEETLCVGT